MGLDSSIEWTGATWNPWMGCHKISPGCKNCYMYADMERYGKDPATVKRSKTTFQDPLTLKWRKPMYVFTCSWSDFFIQEADDWRADAWAIIKRTPWLTYQILTKRPENIRTRLPPDWGAGYKNVWLGTSVESAGYLARLDELLAVPASLHFVSYEPALGPIQVGPWLWPKAAKPENRPALGWVIVGGESVGGREFHLRWARDVVRECKSAGVPVFVKQLGTNPYVPDGEALVQINHPKGGDPGEWPEDLRIREIPPLAAGGGRP
jgi:protein gp37